MHQIASEWKEQESTYNNHYRWINVLALLLVQKILPGKQVILNTSTSSGVVYLHLFHTSNEIWWTRQCQLEDSKWIWKMQIKSRSKWNIYTADLVLVDTSASIPITEALIQQDNGPFEGPESLCLNNITHWQTSDKLKLVFTNWTAICNGSPVVNAGKAEPGIRYKIEVKELIVP